MITNDETNTINCIGDLCPIPVTKLGRKMRQVNPGTEVVLISDDPMVEIDVKAWCMTHDHELIRVDKIENIYYCRVK